MRMVRVSQARTWLCNQHNPSPVKLLQTSVVSGRKPIALDKTTPRYTKLSTSIATPVPPRQTFVATSYLPRPSHWPYSRIRFGGGEPDPTTPREHEPEHSLCNPSLSSDDSRQGAMRYRRSSSRKLSFTAMKSSTWPDERRRATGLQASRHRA